MRVVTHVGPTDYAKYGADFSEDPDAVLRDFDAFQWALYWGDRPAMDTVASLILHGLFGRFPNVRVCLSEQGTVWLPYLLRKLDATYHLGRPRASASSTGARARSSARTSWSRRFPRRTSRAWSTRWGSSRSCSAPTSRMRRGSRFRAITSPRSWAALREDQVLAIMRDNLAGFLGIES